MSNKKLVQRGKTRIRVFADIQNFALLAHCGHRIPSRHLDWWRWCYILYTAICQNLERGRLAGGGGGIQEITHRVVTPAAAQSQAVCAMEPLGFWGVCGGANHRTPLASHPRIWLGIHGPRPVLCLVGGQGLQVGTNNKRHCTKPVHSEIINRTPSLRTYSSTFCSGSLAPGIPPFHA